MDTKGGHTESAAFLSGNLALLFLRVFVGAQLSGLCWERGHGPNGTVGADSVRQQDRSTHTLDKTTPHARFHSFNNCHYSKLEGKKPPFSRNSVFVSKAQCNLF